MVQAMFVLTVSVTMGLGALQWGQNLLSERFTEMSETEARYANDRAITLAGYLVSNNLVVCRDGGFARESGRKCTWAGDLHKPKAISPSAFELKKGTPDRQDLRLDLALSKDLTGNSEGGPKLKVTLSFRLVNWSTEPKLLDFVGRIPNENAVSDDDWFMVLAEAATEYRDAQGQMKTLKTSGGIRRPLGTPLLDLWTSPICHFSCQSSLVESPTPDCRGPQIVKRSDEGAPAELKLGNLGPGAIVDLAYHRVVLYDRLFYPSLAGVPQINRVAMLGGKEILMPGENLSHIDTFTCRTPEVFQASNTSDGTTRETENQVYLNTFRYAYSISPSRFDPEDPSFSDTTRRPAFLRQYNPFDPRTFRPNPTQSSLEPKKAGGTLTGLDSNLIRLPPIEPPVTPPEIVGGDGGGDGDGGGGGN